MVGLYADSGAGSPGPLLAQASISAPAAGAWNTAAVAPVDVAAGSRYWLAVLQPSGSGGVVQFRDGSAGPRADQRRDRPHGAADVLVSGDQYVSAPVSAFAAR